MLKEGDTIVCIDETDSRVGLIKYKNYIVKTILGWDYIIIEEFNKEFFLSKRFILLSEFRKQKINNIKARICLKKVTK